MSVTEEPTNEEVWRTELDLQWEEFRTELDKATGLIMAEFIATLEAATAKLRKFNEIKEGK